MKRLVWHIAFRYLRGKRGLNAVPVLSRISMVAIGIGTAAMIILFSVFNGFEGVVQDLYKAFYPDIKISLAKGKFFDATIIPPQKLQQINGIGKIAAVMEDNVLVSSNDEQMAVTLKGIDKNFLTVNNIRPYIIDGVDTISTEPATAITGVHIASQLGLDITNAFSDIMIYYPDASEQNLTGLGSGFQSLRLKPSGIFRIQDEFDRKYMLASLPLVQQLFKRPNNISSLEIKLVAGANALSVKRSLQELIGEKFKVQTRYEQNQTLYSVMNTEKWVVYAILFLVLLIASFNMIGALSLLVLGKQKDMAILTAMGANHQMVRHIFITEGMLWTSLGGFTGLLVGTLVCLGQQYFHWIKLEGSFIIEAYPIAMKWQDFVLIIFTIFIVGLLAAWYPAKRATNISSINLRS